MPCRTQSCGRCAKPTSKPIKMKVFLLGILLSITTILYGQDSLLVQSWKTLTTELRNRVNVAENFGILALSGKLGDTSNVNYLNELCSFLKKNLNKNTLPDSLLIDSIKTYTLILLGTINRIRLFVDDISVVQTRNEFRVLENSLAQAGERISMISKSYNERCVMTGRADLIY